jgi:zinc protease
VLSGLRRETTSPNDIASRTWWKTAFPDHPYGKPTNGTLESVPQITAEDLKAYARRVLARDTLKVAVVGDIDATELGKVLDRVFGALPAKAELNPVPNVSLQAMGRRIVVDLDVPQAVLTLGGPASHARIPTSSALWSTISSAAAHSPRGSTMRCARNVGSRTVCIPTCFHSTTQRWSWLARQPVPTA